jgi:hypothetical protein
VSNWIIYSQLTTDTTTTRTRSRTPRRWRIGDATGCTRSPVACRTSRHRASVSSRTTARPIDSEDAGRENHVRWSSGLGERPC